MRKGEKVGEGRRVRLKCEYCGQGFERYVSRVKRPGQGRFCSQGCQRKGTAPERRRFGPEHGKWRGGVAYRRKALDAFGESCARCGYEAYPELLWVHHKNFKPRKAQDDHSLENLEVLCVRCHMEVHIAFQEPGSAGLHVREPSPAS